MICQSPPGGYRKMKKQNGFTPVKRLKIAQGHLEKVIGMVEEGAYCIDIVHQSMAIQAALKKVDEIILERHLKNCVVDSIREGKKDEVIGEVMRVFEKK